MAQKNATPTRAQQEIMRRNGLNSVLYYEANKQKLLDYQRRYRQKRREAKKNAPSDGANIGRDSEK